MPVSYLTKDQILQHYKSHIGKKEVAIQTEGSTITLNSEQIVIITDEKYSRLRIKIRSD